MKELFRFLLPAFARLGLFLSLIAWVLSQWWILEVYVGDAKISSRVVSYHECYEGHPFLTGEPFFGRAWSLAVYSEMVQVGYSPPGSTFSGTTVSHWFSVSCFALLYTALKVARVAKGANWRTKKAYSI